MTDPSTHDHPAKTIAKAVGGRAAVPIASVSASTINIEHSCSKRERLHVPGAVVSRRKVPALRSVG